MAVNESKARPDSPQWANWKESPPGAVGTMVSAFERTNSERMGFIDPATAILEHGQNLLLHEAKRYLGDIPNISRALISIKEDPEIYRVRMQEFEYVIGFLGVDLALYDADEDEELGIAGELQTDKLVNAFALVESQPVVNHMLVSNPGEFLWWSTDKDELVSAARSTFLDIREKVKTGEWEFPVAVTDPKVLTSALLIEGYGLFLENITGEEGTARRFVLGFEEVLWNQMRDSEMLDDVLPWMIEERGEFSPAMRDELSQLVVPQAVPQP